MPRISVTDLIWHQVNMPACLHSKKPLLKDLIQQQSSRHVSLHSKKQPAVGIVYSGHICGCMFSGQILQGEIRSVILQAALLRDPHQHVWQPCLLLPNCCSCNPMSLQHRRSVDVMSLRMRTALTEICQMHSYALCVAECCDC